MCVHKQEWLSRPATRNRRKYKCNEIADTREGREWSVVVKRGHSRWNVETKNSPKKVMAKQTEPYAFEPASITPAHCQIKFAPQFQKIKSCNYWKCASERASDIRLAAIEGAFNSAKTKKERERESFKIATCLLYFWSVPFCGCQGFPRPDSLSLLKHNFSLYVCVFLDHYSFQTPVQHSFLK